MLRDFVYNQDKELVLTVLQDLKIDLPHEQHLIALTKFEVITPDSFMWRLLIDGTVYYLYAEDFVRGPTYLKSTINSYLESDAWEFVAPKRIKKFEETSPAAAAATYQKKRIPMQ